MTGSTLPQSVKPIFHEFCNRCKYLKFTTAEMEFTAVNRVWNEYTISCKHYDACGRVRDFFHAKGGSEV